jgi:hypothetical protein
MIVAVCVVRNFAGGIICANFWLGWLTTRPPPGKDLPISGSRPITKPGRNLNGRFGEGKRRARWRQSTKIAGESVLAIATLFSVASLVGRASDVATFGLADIAVQDVVPTKNLIRAGCAYRLGHPNVLTVKTVEP